ncbi:MAG: TlyA family RNA methyltransferase, partial [Campylobacter sp.]|nr:TlyA family RNA methyltransferase [Campylobacter sp.]
VLLMSGASSVVCVDVGEGQLDSTLRADPRIICRESTDIRDFASTYCAKSFALITADLSFIPLSLVLPCIKTLANDEIIVLFKPQFEVGLKAKRDKKGVVCDQKAINEALADFNRLCADFGFKILAQENSAIKGKNGNQEIFFHLKV